MQLSTAIIRIGRNQGILSRLTRVLFINDIRALLTFFLFLPLLPCFFLAFLTAPVNPHLSKYIIFTWKIILYYIVKKNGLHINIQRLGKNCSDLVQNNDFKAVYLALCLHFRVHRIWFYQRIQTNNLNWP